MTKIVLSHRRTMMTKKMPLADEMKLSNSISISLLSYRFDACTTADHHTLFPKTLFAIMTMANNRCCGVVMKKGATNRAAYAVTLFEKRQQSSGPLQYWPTAPLSNRGT